MTSVSRPRIMGDGTIVYIKRGWEPPPPIDGYRRKSEQGADAWIFIPEWPACRHRTIREQVRACGAINIIATCNLKRFDVQVIFCKQCGDQTP